MPAVRKILHDDDPLQPISNVRTLRDRVRSDGVALFGSLFPVMRAVNAAPADAFCGD
jgi:hypothetical protein